MDNLLQDPMTFYAIAFVIFLGFAFRYGRKPLLGWIDAEIVMIRDELDQAQKLRVESEAVLATYKEKQTEVMAEAEAIIKQAREDAERMKTRAAADLEVALARAEQQAAERIRIAENEAMASVRVAAVEFAVAMARKSLENQMDQASAAKLTDQAIAEIPGLATTKSKAA